LKSLRIVLAGVAGLLLVLALLAWFLPARWAVAALGPRLHGLRLEQVGGSLWNGRAGRVLDAAGGELGRVQWTLSRRALLGDVRLHLAAQRPGMAFSGDMHRRSAGAADWSDVQVQADAARLGDLPGLDVRGLHGRLNVHIVHARMQGVWPMELEAAAQWHDGAVDEGGARLALGGFHLHAQGEGGVIRLEMGDDGHGPLQAQGRASLSPLGWRYAAILQPRTNDPALRQWLAGFGKPAPDGTLHLHGSGGLARFTPRMEQR
jgi:general secretion pathway protein N